MSSECPAPLLDLDVRYDQRVNIQTLDFGITLSIVKQIQNEVGTFHMSIGTAEGNGLLVDHNIL